LQIADSQSGHDNHSTSSFTHRFDSSFADLVMTSWFLPLALALAANPDSTDWPRFRGPNGTGLAATSAPTELNAKDLIWKVPVPGKGWSSPIISKGVVYLQTSTDDKRMLVAFNLADGKTLWTRDLPGKTAHTHKKNSLASGTPVVDGNAVYCVVWDGDTISLQAFDLAGKPLWNSPIGGYTSQHGPAHSPVLHSGLVFVNYDQDGGAEFLAFDAKTGKKAWSAPRKPERACYATPLILERAGKPAELLVGSTHQLTSYDPATGKVNWDYPFVWASGKMPLRAIAAPIVAGNTITCFFGDGGGSRYAVAVDPSKGSSPTMLWEARKDTPYVPCPVARGEHLFWITDKGFAVCAEVKTGKIVWNERVFTKDVSASPVLVGDTILAIAEDGRAAAIKASPQFEEAKLSSLGQDTFCTPAIADGKLVIRGSSDLFCYGSKK